MRTNKSEVTVVTLANGCELVASIAAEVLGTTLPDSLNGSPLNRLAIYSLANQEFQSELSKATGGIDNADA